MAASSASVLTDETNANVKRFSFSDNQKTVLKKWFYENGVQSVGKQNTQVISKIASEIEVQENQVKNWIIAENSRAKKKELPATSQASVQESVVVRKTHKRTSFQLFCSQECSKVSGDGPTVMSELSRRWSALPSPEKREWKEKASSGGFCTEQSKKSLVRDLTSAIDENLKSLSTLGYEGFAIVLDKSTGNEKVMCGSDCSHDFILAEEERGECLETNFFKYMCASAYLKSSGKWKKSSKPYKDMLVDVRAGLRQKYCAASGNGRIPYSHLENLTKRYAVLGLPEGVPFKQPSEYTRQELRQVFNCLDKIEFLPLAEVTVTGDLCEEFEHAAETSVE